MDLKQFMLFVFEGAGKDILLAIWPLSPDIELPGLECKFRCLKDRFMTKHGPCFYYRNGELIQQEHYRAKQWLRRPQVHC